MNYWWENVKVENSRYMSFQVSRVISKSMETVIESSVDKGGQAAVISQGVDRVDGLGHFFLEEDRKLKSECLHSSRKWLTFLLFCVDVAVIWLSPSLACRFLAVLAGLFLFFLERVQCYRTRYWEKLNYPVMALKGIRDYLMSRGLPVKEVFALNFDKDNFVCFNGMNQVFLFLTENSMQTIRISKCDVTKGQQGGWNLIAESSREVLSLEDYQKLPNGENPEVYGLYTFEKFLEEKRGAKVSISTMKRYHAGLTLFFEQKDGIEGYCCIVARKPDGKNLYIVTADSRWKDFPRLWEKVLVD